MKGSDRVIVNTAAQYIRSAVNLCLSLISARLILNALGVEDYGIYSLVASTVTLLSFVINAMVVTTQRFLSFYTGRNDPDRLKEIFANSLIVHVVLGVVLAVLFEVAGIFLFDGFLNISQDRIDAARIVFHIVTLNVMLSFVTAPFRALLIARENIVYVSAVEVADAVMRLIIAYLLTICTSDRLVLYAALLCGVSLVNLLLYAVYDAKKYEECVRPSKHLLRTSVIREMSSFATWTIYSIFCITGRTQGVAIIINRFFGVVMNAAYGIGMQVHNSVAFLSQSVVNAMNPQIMKAEGAGDRKKMLRLAEVESKFCFMLLSMFLVPCVAEMPALLNVWLGKVPDYSVFFCRGLLVATLLDQLTIGLGAANQAVGRIRNYSLAVNTIKILTIPAVVAGLYFTEDYHLIMFLYVLFEFTCAMVRLYFLKKTAGLSVASFIRNVFARELLPILFLVGYCAVLVSFVDLKYRFILTIFSAPVVYAAAIYYTGLCPDEKEIIISLLRKVKRWVANRRKTFLGRCFPKRLASVLFQETFGRKMDWSAPNDLNEKINWLKFHSDQSVWAHLADKYRVRTYVSSKGYGDTLVRLYGVWDNPYEIDWESLPDRFILKMNNGSGDAMICRSKASFDKEYASDRLAESFRHRFGIMTAEPHYLKIDPFVIAEELLDASKQSVGSDSLIDYKIWCLNGVPECIFVIANRTNESMEIMVYDLQWQPHPEYLVVSDHYRLLKTEIPSPAGLEFMIRMASDLSAGFPQMRVDLYEVGGKVYFGELTLTSACGLMGYFTPDYLRAMGKKVKLL